MDRSALIETVFNKDEDYSPKVILVLEKTTGEFIRGNNSQIKACTDLSNGGLELPLLKSR